MTARRVMTVKDAQDRSLCYRQIGECRACPLAFMGNGPVHPDGPTPNDIMVLAESPTRDDDRARQISHAGEPSTLLRRLIAKTGLDPTDLFYVNTVSCWPGWKKTATTKDVRACAHNLRMQISTCDPYLVLVLGATALAAVSDDPKRRISSHHGRPFRPLAGPLRDRWVFPTWHPGALKKNPGAVTDLSVDIDAMARFYRAMTEADWPKEGLKPWV